MEKLKIYLDLVLLSSPGTHDEARARKQKKEWIRKHLGDDVNFIMKHAKQKHHYACPRSVLIDDWHKNIVRWSAAGGLTIHHRSAEQTLAELSALGATLP